MTDPERTKAAPAHPADAEGRGRCRGVGGGPPTGTPPARHSCPVRGDILRNPPEVAGSVRAVTERTYGPNTSHVIAYLRELGMLTEAQIVIAGRGGVDPYMPEFDEDAPYSPWDVCLTAARRDIGRVLESTEPYRRRAAEREGNRWAQLVWDIPQHNASRAFGSAGMAIAVGRGLTREEYKRSVARARESGLRVPSWKLLDSLSPNWDGRR